jgi:signal transduction histidine kinase
VNYDVFINGVHPEDREAANAAIQGALDPAGDGYCYLEYRLAPRPDGQTRWIAATGHVTFERGRAVRLIGTAQDISRQKEFQAELERLVAERTAKLHELVGELEHFSYSITHDMRAPLRAMRGFAEILGEIAADSHTSEIQTFVRRIMTSAERMDLLITDALNYSKAVRQDLPLAPVDLNALLRGMLDSYPEFQSDRANIHLNGQIPKVLGNEAGLTQCMSNLLGNAVKFAKPGQTPNVRVWSEIMEPETEKEGSRLPSAWVRIYVEDDGIGISRNMLPRVFDMFARQSNSYEGTGIGLALVRKVTQRMGGRVGVESDSGEGSRFYLELRAAPAP